MENIKIIHHLPNVCQRSSMFGEWFGAIKINSWENQDGGVGRHTAPPHTTRTDRKLNDKEVLHQGDKK